MSQSLFRRGLTCSRFRDSCTCLENQAITKMNSRKSGRFEPNTGVPIANHNVNNPYASYPQPPQQTMQAPMPYANPYASPYTSLYLGLPVATTNYGHVPPMMQSYSPLNVPHYAAASYDLNRSYHTGTNPQHRPQQNPQSTLPSRPRSPSSHQGEARNLIRKIPTKAAVGRLPLGRNPAAPPSKASGGIPDPTAAYLQTSLRDYTILQKPQHLLVIIDLNGTLLHRPSKSSPTKFNARPHTPRFLNYTITTFTVVIWSSARPENVKAMTSNILTPALHSQVVAIWGRDKFGLSPAEYNSKVQCYKRLSTVWNDAGVKKSHPEAARGGKWDQTNTVLIDDSNYKGRSEPFNLIEIPEYSGGSEEEKEGVLPQVHDYLNRLSLCSNVSNYMRQHSFSVQRSQAG